jgi:hypothetical protein
MRSLRTYVFLWILVTAALIWDHFAIRIAPDASIIHWLNQAFQLDPGLKLTTKAGKTISLWYGWIGLGTMALTNLYVIRKRLPFVGGLGTLGGWLNFHIFCGLVGPTFILFHTNFRVRGLVAISFWSMVVSFTSGIVGRYFYMQINKQLSELDRELKAYDSVLKQHQMAVAPRNPEIFEHLKAQVLATAGAYNMGAVGLQLPRTLYYSLFGDLALAWRLGSIRPKVASETRAVLKHYAVTARRILYLDQFRRIMGYWHAFHMPFAVFMYVVAAIHVAAALLLSVPA